MTNINSINTLTRYKNNYNKSPDKSLEIQQTPKDYTAYTAKSKTITNSNSNAKIGDTIHEITPISSFFEKRVNRKSSPIVKYL